MAGRDRRIRGRRRGRGWRLGGAAAAVCVLASGCAGGHAATPQAATPQAAGVPAAGLQDAGQPGGSPAGDQHGGARSGQPDRPRGAWPRPAGAASASPSTPAKPLAGMIVAIDPGHNGGNGADSPYVNSLIWNGRNAETCDTTGTQTDEGYPEPRFNFNVATFLRADLRRDGAQVVMTRTSNGGVGPCVTRRAQIINRSHAGVAIDIHADGGPVPGRGFAVLEPVADGMNTAVIAASERFGRDVRSAFLRYTTMPVSTYDGVDGIAYRDDLAGLNLTRVPKVLIESGNMRNSTDAALLTSTSFQELIARALGAAIVEFLATG